MNVAKKVYMFMRWGIPARVVPGLIAETVTMGEIEDVRTQLPPAFARLFEVENEGEIPELGQVADIEEDL